MMLKFGEVYEQNQEKHAVRVRDLDLQIKVPGWLSVGADFVGGGSSYNLPPVGATVAYIRHKNPESIGDISGFVLRGVYTSPGASWGDKNKIVLIRVSDTQLLQYDTSTGQCDIFGPKVVVKSSDIELGENPTEPAVLGNQLKTLLDVLIGTTGLDGALGLTNTQLKGLGAVGFDSELANLLTLITPTLATQVKVK